MKFLNSLCGLHGWALPPSLEEEIKSEDALPLGRAPWAGWLLGWIDNETLVETADLHNTWLAEAACHLVSSKPWDVYYHHIHATDIMYHTFSMDIDPTTAKDPSLTGEFEATELAVYQSVDRAMGRIIAAAGDDVLVVVTSDHGAKPKTHAFDAAAILEKAGLLVYRPTTEGEPRQIDWSRTKAAPQRTVYVYVNTRGRDPNGIVEPGEEYERVQGEVVKALHGYVDPNTGLKPVILALKKDDARILGLYGDRVGDVVYAVDPRFGKEHGNLLPTARYGIGDMRSLFIMAGPGVRKGTEIERTVWLTDIVPTICFVAELPVPAQCEGAIIYQALEDPDAQVRELQSLRRNVERLKRMVERPPMC